MSAEEISQRYIQECKKDMEAMNIMPATTNPLATQEISGMIDMIQTLIDKDTPTPPRMARSITVLENSEITGKLSHKNLDDLEAATAVSM